MKAVYLDSSALVKMVVEEPESVALWRFLEDWPERATSVLGQVELTRALRRAAEPEPIQTRTASLLARLTIVGLVPQIVALAERLDPPELRTLDALHLATVVVLGDSLAGLVAYDRRLLAAARRAGVTCWAPGGRAA